MIMPKNVVCKKCNNLVNDWCEKVIDSPDPDMQRDCQHFCEKTNADRIRSRTDEELAKWLNSSGCICESCSHSAECVDPYNLSRCVCGVLEWLKQPAESEGVSVK